MKEVIVLLKPTKIQKKKIENQDKNKKKKQNMKNKNDSNFYTSFEVVLED